MQLIRLIIDHEVISRSIFMTVSFTHTLNVHQVYHGVTDRYCRAIKNWSCPSSSMGWKSMDNIIGLAYCLNWRCLPWNTLWMAILFLNSYRNPAWCSTKLQLHLSWAMASNISIRNPWITRFRESYSSLTNPQHWRNQATPGLSLAKQ